MVRRGDLAPAVGVDNMFLEVFAGFVVLPKARIAWLVKNHGRLNDNKRRIGRLA